MSCSYLNTPCNCCQCRRKEAFDQRAGEILSKVMGYDDPQNIKSKINEMLNAFIFYEPETTPEERNEARWAVSLLNEMLDNCSEISTTNY